MKRLMRCKGCRRRRVCTDGVCAECTELAQLAEGFLGLLMASVLLRLFLDSDVMRERIEQIGDGFADVLRTIHGAGE